MTKRKLALVLGIAAAFAVGVIAVAAFSTGGSDPPGEGAVSNAPDAAAEESVSRSAGSDGVGEGIGVSGEWVLTVLNEDGSIAETHEFHNDLSPEVLERIFRGQWQIRLTDDKARWRIVLFLEDGSFSGPCPLGEAYAEGTCLSSGFAEMFYSDFAEIDDGFGPIEVTLETEPFAGPATIIRVRTAVDLCSTGSSSCSPGFFRSFTTTDIDPVEVLENQRVFVTVTLSFMTAPTPTPAP